MRSSIQINTVQYPDDDNLEAEYWVGFTSFPQIYFHFLALYLRSAGISNLGLTDEQRRKLCRSPLRQSFIGSPVFISFLSGVHGPVLFTVSHFLRPSSFPTSPAVHQFPVGARCAYGGAVCNDLVNQLQYTAI